MPAIEITKKETQLVNFKYNKTNLYNVHFVLLLFIKHLFSNQHNNNLILDIWNWQKDN